MKTLYLHCGYHKTGSSFLQTMFARNRDLLEKNSICYPYSYRELDMLQGNISPGNGEELSKSLTSGSSELTSNIIKKGIEIAQKNGSNCLLYSNEGLFHAFAKRGALSRLCEAAQKSGFDNIKALVYFRDPVSHSLSTYKHRAKRGDYRNFKKWLNENYETMDLLVSFARYNSEYPIKWSCRKYSPDSKFMAHSSFTDWLGLQVPKIPEDDRVNSSLTLSEILVIQSIKNCYPEYIQHLYNGFINIDKQNKSDDKELNSLYMAIASHVLKRHSDLIESINYNLPKNEKLEIKKVSYDGDLQENGIKVSLNENQIESFTESIQRAIESQKPIRKIEKLWERGIIKIKRRLKASGF